MSRQARDQSATPARNTRGQSQTPLPSIATKQSHAYGAQGKTNLHTQVRASGSNFAEDFTGRVTRSRAGSLEPEIAASPVKMGGGRLRGARRSPEIEPLEEGDEEEEEQAAVEDDPTDPTRVPTSLGPGGTYGASPAAAQSAGMVFAVQEPSAWRKFQEIFVALFFFLLCLGIVYIMLPLSGEWADARFLRFWALGALFGIPGYEKPPNYATEMWYRARHDAFVSEMLPDHNMPEIQWAVNLNVLERLKDSENKQADLKSTLGLHGETLEYLKSILPVTVVLQDDGEQQYSIPPEFFEALSQRIAQGGDAVSPLWDSFISSNEARIFEMSSEAAERIVSEAAERKQIVTRDAFAETIEQLNLDLAARYTADFRNMWEQNVQMVRDIAQQTTEETIKGFTTHQMVKRQLDVLIKSVDLSNSYAALRSYNWFTLGAGAAIDGRLTSATADPIVRDGFKGWWRGEYIDSNPAGTVLLPWTDVTDCWCAAPSPDGSAQISMELAEKMYPEEVIIEHMPTGGTRKIQNAPRDIEVWVQLDSAEDVARYKKHYADQVGGYFTPECTKPPSDRHICLEKGTYNIHSSNHIQRFQIRARAEDIGLAVNRFTVRIVNNWGGQQTCIYRIRLLGDELLDEEDTQSEDAETIESSE